MEVKTSGIKLILALCLGAGLLLSSCFFEDNEKKWPALKKEDLLGCWYTNKGLGGCVEDCYYANDSLYTIWDVNADNDRVVEAKLGYRLSRDSMYYSGMSLFSKKMDTNSRGGGIRFVYLNDTLWGLTSQGEIAGFIYIRSDSVHNCNPHWRLFKKPEGWSF